MMRLLHPNLMSGRGNILPNQSMAESVDAPVSQVTGLIRERRRIALAYRRSRSEVDRDHLARIDRELTAFNIDIPAILESVARRKT